MNVLLLAEVTAERVIGGAERVLRQQAMGLHRLGHRVTVVARAPVGDDRALVRVGEVLEHRYVVTRSNELAFAATSVRRSLLAFDQAIAGGPLDVAVIHQSLAGLGAALFRRAKAKHWVYLCHSLAHEEFASRVARGSSLTERIRWWLNGHIRYWVERVVMRCCDRVVVLSEFMRDRVCATHRIAPEHLHVIPGAADPAIFSPPTGREDVRRSLRLPLNRVMLLTVRNLVPRMGLENLVEAIALLGEEKRDLLLLIGGEGPLRPRLQALIHRVGLATQVRLLGFVPEESLHRYYQAADLVVMPTHQLEGFGLVTVEALACGTPVLGTPVGALPEVLMGIDPHLVAPGTDAAPLAEAIRHLLRRFREQPGEQERIARKGRALIEQKYNWASHCKELEGVFRKAA